MRSREAVIADLGSELAEKREALEKIDNELEAKIREAEKRFVDKISLFETKLKTPQKSLKELKDNFHEREKELNEFQEDTLKLSQELDRRDGDLNARDKSLQEKREEIEALWLDYLETKQENLDIQIRSYKKRNDLLEERSKRLDKERTKLNDRLRSFKVTEKEFLKKQNE